MIFTIKLKKSILKIILPCALFFAIAGKMGASQNFGP
jgi:hypothetical protein